MRRLLVCLSVVAMTGALTAPAATSTESTPQPDDLQRSQLAIAGVTQTTPVPASAVIADAGLRTSVRTAAWRDPADGPIPQRDLRRLSTTHNRSTGALRAAFTFGARPTQPTTGVVGMYLGKLRNNTCHANAVIISKTHTGKGQWARFTADGTITKAGNASYSRSGSTVTLRAKARALRVNATCAFAALTDPSAETEYDGTGYARLRMPPRPKLALYTPSTRTHTSGAAGSWKRVKVLVDNIGEAKAKRVRVRISAPKGVQVKPRRLSFKPIKAGNDRTKSVRIKLKKRSTKTVQLTATASKAAKRTRKLVIHAKPKPLSKNLVGRYFWGFKSHDDFAWDNRAVAIVNRKFAYVGFPKRGVPKCRKVTKKCKRYHFNKRTGKLRVGGKKGHYRKGKLALGGISYYPTKLPKAGSRWTVSLIHRGFNGCQVFMPCSTWAYRLTLRKNGRFVLTRSSIHTLRDGQRKVLAGTGRYRIRRNGHLVLKYASGKTRHETIAIDTDRKRRPDVYGSGLIIGETNYYP